MTDWRRRIRRDNWGLLKAILSNVILFTTGFFTPGAVRQLKLFAPLSLRSRLIVILAYALIFVYMTSIYGATSATGLSGPLYPDLLLYTAWPAFLVLLAGLTLTYEPLRRRSETLLPAISFGLLNIVFAPLWIEAFLEGFADARGVSAEVDPDRVSAVDTSRTALLFQALIATAVTLYFHAIEEVVMRQREMDAEIKVARRIQGSLLPEIELEESTFEAYGRSVSAHEVGGDFFDVVRLGKAKCAVAVGDVSGHNVSASLVMAMVKSTFRAELRHAHAPRQIVASLNEVVCANTDRRTFVTFAYGLFDFANRSMMYVGAGHLPLFQVVGNTGAVVTHRTPNLGLGLRRDATFADKHVDLKSGDTFLFLTDGIPEARDVHGHEYGMENLSQKIQGFSGHSARKVYEALLMDLDRYTGGRPLRDDATIVVLTIPG